MISGFFKEHRWLSNFWIHPVTYQHVTAPTAEHHYQAAKALDPADAAMILAAETPGTAKRLGTAIALRPDWGSVRYQIMQGIVTAKFADPALRQLLLATEDEALVEENSWHDTTWGVCSCETHQGAGTNWLGQILMTVRERLRENTETR